MNFGLDQETIDKINSFFAKYPEIEEVVIYDSRAKGNYREGSERYRYHPERKRCERPNPHQYMAGY
ncbi:nucleotidyltransferase domain-containing protein [Rhodoflexus caldus]|uniref:nucleotidyltransferase domain-containing protein n=1 Tax=Rhodoflexus caldus TaxID=2891236 RepID=UPI002029F4B6|nr:nucleotidyltransferase domain-containing protein [Rhodoflexus caldus]